MTIFWIWANDIIPFWLFCLVLYYIYSAWKWWTVIDMLPDPEKDPNIQKRAKFFAKMEKEQLQIEN